MAASRILLDEVSDLTECSVCVEIMLYPRMLPCFHTFCLACLEQLWEEISPGNSVPCPLCRAEFVIPCGGLAALKSNFLVQKLIDAQKLSLKDEQTRCDICSGRKIENNATKFCIECQQLFCDQCSDAHMFIKSTKFHQILSLGDQSELGKHTTQFSGYFYCEQHRGNRLEMHCNDCSVAVCTVCSQELHKEHDVLDVTKSIEEYKIQIGMDVVKIGHLSSEVSKKLHFLDVRSRIFRESAEETEGAILRKAEEIKRRIDDHTQVLLQELNQEKSS